MPQWSKPAAIAACLIFFENSILKLPKLTFNIYPKPESGFYP
jgi:hypothetical protein